MTWSRVLPKRETVESDRPVHVPAASYRLSGLGGAALLFSLLSPVKWENPKNTKHFSVRVGGRVCLEWL